MPAADARSTRGIVCAGSGHLFFSDDPTDQAKARAACLQCAARPACRDLGRREPDGIWGGLTRAQRDAAGLTLPEIRYCICGDRLPDHHPLPVCSPDCVRQRSTDARRQARAEVSAARSCARCDVHLWPQARSCLVCGHIVGDPIPNQPWPPQPNASNQ